MPLLAEIFAVLAAALHVVFFALESVLFARPDVWRRFGLRSQEEADVIRPMAFNQGFYNLFLAIGVVVGVVVVHSSSETVGRTLVIFCCSCMLAAGVVLFATDRRLRNAAAVQALPPLVAVVVALAG
jgi:putative membrane protein